MNYWPMSNLSDVIGGANLYGGTNYAYTYDRFCNVNQAVYLNSGYFQVPSGVYFSGDFTITAWINLKSLQQYSRIIDFGNGAPSDNVLLAMDSTGSILYQGICQGTSCIALTSSLSFSLNQWYHVAFVLNGTIGYIYSNGIQVSTGTLNLPNIINRTSNYIGKSNSGSNPNAYAIYDDLRIYQGAMTAAQVLSDYISTSNNGL